MAAKRTATFAAVLLWRSLPLVPAEDTEDCDPDVNMTNPFNSCICKHWEKFYKKMYPDVDYDACERLANDKEIGDEFLAWIKKYKKEYPDRMEKRKRYATFAANFVYLKFQNRTTNDYECEVNEFADQSPEEFKSKLANNMLGAAPGPNIGEFNPSSQQIPDEWDWVEQGAVNPPMNQGNAQSCWAFTTAAAIEGGWKARTGNLVELSPQQFVDCTGHGLDAVRGGELTSPITYVAVEHDLCSDESYPYIEMDGVCTQTEDHCQVQIPRGAVVGYQNVQPYSELALMTALYQSGPVGVGIDGMGKEVMFYKSGVLTAPCSANLNHAVTAVGYGTQGNLPYWKIKNSWGTEWGESGYFRLIRGIDGAGGCGIKSIPAVPVFTEDTAVVGPVHSGALGADKEESSTDDLISDTKSKWENGTVSLSGAVIISAGCLCAGLLCGVCCGRSSKTSRGIGLLEEDDDEEYGEEDE